MCGGTTASPSWAAPTTSWSVFTSFRSSGKSNTPRSSPFQREPVKRLDSAAEFDRLETARPAGLTGNACCLEKQDEQYINHPILHEMNDQALRSVDKPTCANKQCGQSSQQNGGSNMTHLGPS